MGNGILLRASLKRHKGVLCGILILTLLACAVLGTVLTVWTDSRTHIGSELERAGFGALTAWVVNLPDTTDLENRIEALSEIERVEAQSLICSGYTANGMESDSEGQLIPYLPAENRYRFFNADLSGYASQPEAILPGEVYVSPSMITMFGIGIGDEITFPVARAGRTLTLTVKGFYEDPFMGSSMIGMKGFLISESDRDAVSDLIQNAGIDALARVGAMLHIFPAGESTLTVSELSSLLNEQTDLAEYTEAVHSRETIAGFMLILQNAFSAILLAFVLVLLAVVLIVLSHSIGSTIASDFVNMGILKTVGLDSGRLRLLQLVLYGIPAAAGLVIGFLLSVPLSGLMADAALTTTGVLIPVSPSLRLTAIAFLSLLLILASFIFVRTRKIRSITPMKTIRGETDGGVTGITKPAAFGSHIRLRLAFRQLMSGKRRYRGAFVVALLLVFFASLVGRMDSWLGSDGKGMMDAFNPADHDIGVQSFGDLTREELERVILEYSAITDTYLLAMPAASLNGISYTANVIDEPERFHISEGRTCTGDNEIVITERLAADFGIGIGDTVTVRGDVGSGEYLVSGIYSCANDMGDNFGMSREGYLRIGRDFPNLWCRHFFLADSSQKAAITEALESAFGGDVHVHENSWPGLSGIIAAMRGLLVLMYALVVLFILIVTGMTGSKILSAEQKDIGIYKAIGFSPAVLCRTFALRFAIVSVSGGLVGMLLSAVVTDPLVSGVMKSAGIANFKSHPGLIRLLLPVGIVTALFTAFAGLLAGKIRKVPLTVLAAD